MVKTDVKEKLKYINRWKTFPNRFENWENN